MNRIRRYRACIVTLLLIVMGTAPAHAQPRQNRCVTCFGDWFVSSPKINTTDLHSKTNIQVKLPIDHIHALGKKAQSIWSTKKNDRDACIDLQTTFAFIDRTFLVKAIDQILQEPALLAKITKASYRNATGFLKIVLATGEGDDAWKIRLHVWTQRQKKEFPHSHKWDFFSKIMSGYLTQEVYTQSNVCNNDSDYRVHEPVSLMLASEDGQLPCPCRDDYILNPKKNMDPAVSLQLDSTTIIGTGESYFMPNHIVHTIIPSKDAISFIFTSCKKTENSNVLVPTDKVHKNLACNAPSVTPEELKQELLIVKDMLEKLHIQKRYLPELVDADHHYFDMNNDDPILQNTHWRSHVHDNPDRKKVIQLSEQELKDYVVSASMQGKISIGTQPIDLSVDYLFVLNNGIMHAVKKDFHHENNDLICHTSFSGYKPVDAAGVLRFNREGKLSAIEAYSGHYIPSKEDMQRAYDYLRALGVDTTSTSLLAYEDRDF